ncbi:MAG: CPBP family intramembrane metalloprotease [Spirulinaceae cyanobacterium SM2_1_0]|nr:CPBP family intramembrane metalloprotease [Spirulinaceae cyanobacterium SM2_1_0]
MPPSANSAFAAVRSRRLLLAFFLLLIGASFASGTVSYWLGIPLDDPLLTYFIFILSFSLTAAWAWWDLQQAGVQPQHLLGRWPRGYNWGWVLGLAIALLAFSLGSGLLSYALLYQLAPDWVAENAESLLAIDLDSRFPKLLMLLEAIALMLVAPLAEEFLFRGVLFHRWAEKWGLTPAIWLSSLLFGLGHANPVGLTIVGVVWTLLYCHSRTLWVPIAAHFLNNATVYLLTRIDSSPAESQTAAALTATLAAGWAPGLLLMIASAPVLGYFIYRYLPRPGAKLPYEHNASVAR